MRARRCSLDAAPWVGGWWPLGAPLARSRGPIHLGIATQRAQRVARPVGRAQGNANRTHANRNPLQSRPSRANVGYRRRRVSPSMRGRLRLRQHRAQGDLYALEPRMARSAGSRRQNK